MNDSLPPFEKQLTILKATALELAESLERVAGRTSTVSPRILRETAGELDRFRDEYQALHRALRSHPEFRSGDISPEIDRTDLDQLGIAIQRIATRVEQRKEESQKRARGLAIVEAIIGQFYIAVLIGELIGKRVSTALSGKEHEEANRSRAPRDS